MKIAVWHNAPGGGAKRALDGQITGLVGRGHEVEVWSPSADNFSWKPWAARGRLSGILSDYRNGVSRMEAMRDSCRRSAEEINRGGFDMLFAYTCFQVASPFITRYVDLPKVLYLHEPNRALHEANPAPPWMARVNENGVPVYRRPFRALADHLRLRSIRLQVREEWLNAKAADLILVNSYFSVESVRRAYGLDSRVCPLGVDTTVFRPLPVEKEPILLGLGALYPHKGVEFAIRSAALLRKPRPKFVWISQARHEAYLEEFQSLADSLGVALEPRFHVTDEELVKTLNQAKLLFYAPYLEPFGYAPLEASACGTPVVAVAEGGVRETVKDGVNGLLVDRDAGQAAAAIQKILDDAALAKRLGESGVAWVKDNWSLSNSLDKLEAFLSGSIKRKPSLAGY